MKKQSKIDQLPVIEDIVQTKIYMLKKQKIMVDIDLAPLYGVDTKVLNQAVRRNLKRFPDDFMFELTTGQKNLLRSQFVTVRDKNLIIKDDFEVLRSQISSLDSKERRKPVFAFTEQGIAMLSSVLRSDRAIQVNIQIMRTFTKLRQMLTTHKELKEKIEELEEKYDGQFREVFNAINRLIAEEEKPKHPMGFQAP